MDAIRNYLPLSLSLGCELLQGAASHSGHSGTKKQPEQGRSQICSFPGWEAAWQSCPARLEPEHPSLSPNNFPFALPKHQQCAAGDAADCVAQGGC